MISLIILKINSRPLITFSSLRVYFKFSKVQLNKLYFHSISYKYYLQLAFKFTIIIV